MAGEKERVDSYLDTVSRLEPDIAMIDAGAGYASIAISLKRIADALKPWMDANEIGDAPNPGYPPVLTNEDFIAAARHLANVTNAPADHAAETVRVVFQAVRWAREGRAQPESIATMDHAGMPEQEPWPAGLRTKFQSPSPDPLDVAARAIMDIDPAGAERFGALDMEQARAFASAAIRAYEAIPDGMPDIRCVMDESFVDYAAMPPAEMLARVGSDGAKWAEAFCQIAYKHGVLIDDEGWMIAWFANAIEAGAQRERKSWLPSPVES